MVEKGYMFSPQYSSVSFWIAVTVLIPMCWGVRRFLRMQQIFKGYGRGTYPFIISYLLLNVRKHYLTGFNNI